VSEYENIVPVDFWNPDPGVMARAGRLIRDGELVAFPTETVYGLGGNALDGAACRKIYAAKGRPSDNPLILHFPNPAEVERAAYVDSRARKLMEHFWPGPLTLVLPARDVVSKEARGGLETVGCRMPDYPAALAFFAACGVPVAGPSANRSGRPSPTNARTVAQDLGSAVSMILDAGECRVGVESTVLDVTDTVPVLLRPGGLPMELVEEFLGCKIAFPVGLNELKRSPGTRYRHYAPTVPVKVWEEGTPFDWPEKFTYMGAAVPERTPERQIRFNTYEAYAHGLFSALRDLEKDGLPIVAQWPPLEGLGRAIRDRISRAAGLS
jgi:L-threonylcarbamoyladenylate synthase